MKFILIALLCSGVALTMARIEEWDWLNQVSPDRKVEDTAFRTGREYRFFYNGQLATGIAGSSKQHSANRIQSMVTIAFKSANSVLMKMQNVRVGKLNREVPNPRKIMPFDAFEDVPIEPHLKAKLETTLKFAYTDGIVHDVVFDSREDPWSANIKRGVLNLLQVNLQQKKRLDIADDARLTNTVSTRDDMDSTFYRVMEETLEGECETLYTVQKQPDNRHSNGPILNVTKSINFEKCNKRPQVKYNFRFSDPCPTCESKYNDDEKFLKSSTVAKYQIIGDKQAFLIETARIDSEYVFVPFNEESNVIVTYVNQTLVLVKSGPIQSNGIQEPQNPVESDSDMIFTLDWDMNYEKFHMSGDSANHRQLHESQAGVNKVQLSQKSLQKMIVQMKDQVDEELPRQFTKLVKLLRMCNGEELEQIVRMQEQGTQSPEDERKLKNIIPQALGACGTKECVKILTHKIRQGQITPARGAFAVQGLLHSRVASKEIIAELMTLVESEKARESEILKRHTWLTIGSLMNALCTSNDDQLALETKEKPEKFCPRELKKEYVDKLFQKLRSAEKWQDKVLMLKTIGNAGLDLSIFELEKFIRQQDTASHPMYIRLESILALRQLKDAMPKKVQRILMPLVMNRQEYPTLRSAASYMLLQTLPDRPLLDQLARSLINEPSHQFAAYLHTQMLSYANSTNPCEKQLSNDMKLALRHAKQIGTGLGYSKMSHWSFHCDQAKSGVDIDVSTVYSNISSIPRQVGVAVHGNFLGFWHKYLATASMFNEGLEPLFRKLFTDRGHLFSSLDTESFEEVIQSAFSSQGQRRHPRQTGSHNNNANEYERELDDIFSKHLKIRNRDYSSEYENEPKAYFWLNFKSQSVGYVPIGKELVQQLLQDSRTNLGQLQQKLRQGVPIEYASVANLHDVHYKIPTTLGMPLSVTIRAPVAWSVKGKIQAHIDPATRSAKLFLELKPSIVATMTCDVETWSPILITGVKVMTKAKLFAPIDARVEVESPAQQPLLIKAVIKPPTQKRDLVVLESRPVTYTREWQRYVRTFEEGEEERTIMGEEQNRVSTYNKCYGRQTFGVEMCVRSQVHHTPLQSVKGTPFAPLSGPNKIVITAEPGAEPQEIQIKFSGKFQVLKGGEQQMQKPSFSNFRRSENQQTSPVDSSSSSESEETDEITSSNNNQQADTRSRGRRAQEKKRQQPSSPRPDFMQQYRNYEMKQAYKTQVVVEMHAGSNRKLNLELTHLFDLKQRYSKVDMRIHRQQPEPWEVCFDAEMMFPESPEFLKDVRDKKIVSQAEVKWGPTCSSSNYIRLSTQAERSGEQMRWERDQSEYKQFQTKQCTNKAWCSPLTQEDFIEEIGHMLKYRVDIDYQNVPNTVQNITNKLYRALKQYYYWQTDVDQINVQNTPGKIRADFVLDPQTKQRVNITIKTPKENVKIQDLPLARPLGVLNLKQSWSEQLNDFVSADEDEAECSITGKTGWNRRSQVETFDGTKFSAPFSDCWVVLAKDCGSESPKFVVMARKSKTNGNGELKDVKVITRRHRIELTPASDDYDTVKVKVNGQAYDPETQDDLTDHGHIVAKIDKEDSSINVELPETGLELDFDGYAINIKLSSLYQGQQCGLCGHFDLESTDEFRNPDFTEAKDVRQFYMNYLIKDGSCQAPSQLKDICNDEECDQDKSSGSSSSSSSDEDDNDNDSTTEKPDIKTKIVEVDDELCFSTIPVPQCDDNSYPIGSKQSKNVPYVCIDQDSESAEHLERRARYGRSDIKEFKNRTPTFTRMESFPEKCKKYSRY